MDDMGDMDERPLAPWAEGDDEEATLFVVWASWWWLPNLRWNLMSSRASLSIISTDVRSPAEWMTMEADVEASAISASEVSVVVALEMVEEVEEDESEGCG